MKVSATLFACLALALRASAESSSDSAAPAPTSANDANVDAKYVYSLVKDDLTEEQKKCFDSSGCTLGMKCITDCVDDLPADKVEEATSCYDDCFKIDSTKDKENNGAQCVKKCHEGVANLVKSGDPKADASSSGGSDSEETSDSNDDSAAAASAPIALVLAAIPMAALVSAL
ncbi:hypothetical protein H4R34_000088 [Dimargaris verticillata]|uniref:Extracellular membrane protein CFEM domain-containing protein n=1 Tax=Dimargaris verticillata TaxID=2761393 RepID=A0A9W8BB06_9FUNG|nr:hypothetical protein H4R34_000088 [Dimargaris verticillata]